MSKELPQSAFSIAQLQVLARLPSAASLHGPSRYVAQEQRLQLAKAT